MTGSILLADADPQAEALAAGLRRLTWRVVHARSFGAARAALGADPPPDAAIIELDLPGRSGLSLIGDLKRRADSTRVLVVTARGTVASAVQAVRRGARAYLCKPVGPTQVVRALSDATWLAGDEPPWPLDAAIAAHLRYAVATTGTVAGAARRLGVDRHSLRRMLARYCAAQDPTT